LIDGLKSFDVKPFVIIPEKGMIEDSLRTRGVPYNILSVPNWTTGDQNPFLNYRRKRTAQLLLEVIGEYRKLIKHWSIDVIYSNSSVSPIGRMSAHLTHKPHIWHIRELLDLDYSLQFIFPDWLTKKYILTSNAVICNSYYVREHFFPKSNRKLHVVYNGIASTSKFDALNKRREENLSKDEFVFSIVGFLHPNKGQDVAIKAITELKKRGLPVRLIIAGGGGLFLDHCKMLAKELELEDVVEFTGYVPDPYEIYRRSSCLLVCSEFEAMGRVTVEGMSARLPVIAKNSGGTPEIMVHGETGFLYDNFDELVNYMEVMTKNPEKARKMGASGWEFAKDRFTIEKYSASIYQIIKSAC
jgi:glycosyltransferase involved in cell wall biosynthesis